MTTQIILGFSGTIASGKGTSAEYLKQQYGAKTYRFSTMLRDILDRVHLEQSRDHLIRLSEILRTEFGEDILAKTMAEDIKKDSAKLIVIDGIRRLADIQYLKEIPGFTLVEIFADPNIRYERLIHRTENSDDAQKSYEEFLEDAKRSTEVSVLEVTKQAQTRIDNNGTLEELYNQLTTLTQAQT